MFFFSFFSTVLQIHRKGGHDCKPHLENVNFLPQASVICAIVTWRSYVSASQNMVTSWLLFSSAVQIKYVGVSKISKKLTWRQTGILLTLHGVRCGLPLSTYKNLIFFVRKHRFSNMEGNCVGSCDGYPMETRHAWRIMRLCNNDSRSLRKLEWGSVYYYI